MNCLSELTEVFIFFLYIYRQVHAADSSMQYSSLAQLFVDVYEFPVLMIVALSDGTIVHKMNANDFLDMEMKSVNIG